MATLDEREAAGRPTVSVPRRKVQFVVKTSKFCNLRCSYCYLFPDLADRTMMRPGQIEHMYRSIANHYYCHNEPVALEFDWHGGEPLLLGPDFYWRTFDQQSEIFDDPQVAVTNCVQTNLTILNEPVIELLSKGFDGVGVSIDLFSGLRVNAGGRNAEPTVLRNMDRLREAGVPFGCITVLSRRNRPHLKRIFRFFAEAAVSPRILPLHRGADDFQNDADLLTEDEVREAFIELFDMWIESPAPIIIEPIHLYTKSVIAAAVAHADAKRYYEKREWETVYIVNTDGNLYSYADAFDVSMSHGNLFEESLHAMVGGPGHLRAVAAAEARMRAVCSDCRHYGRACGGYPMAEEAPGKRGAEAVACTRERGVLDYIEARLHELGILDSDGRLNSKSKHLPRFDPALRMPA